MVNLIRNENLKIYSRPRTWILVGLLIVILILMVLLTKQFANTDGDWRERVQNSIADNQAALNEPFVPEFAKTFIEQEIIISQYQLDHDIPPVNTTVWGGVKDAIMLISLITIFTVIIAGDIVASEFTWGTIKLLLVRPVHRGKILLSKYLASFLFALLLLFILFIFSYIVNGFVYGFSGAGLTYVHLSEDGKTAVESNVLIHVLKTYALSSVNLIMIVTLAFMISTVFRSSTLAVSISVFLLLVGYNLAAFLASNYDWGKYILFANTDLTMYLDGRPITEGMTMTFSIIVLIVYFILFNALSYVLFNKRDVAA